MKPEIRTAKTIISIGTPACVTQIALSLLSLTCNHVANKVGGSAAVAAYGIVYSVIMLVYMPVLGLGQGVQPIIGYNYSSKIMCAQNRPLHIPSFMQLFFVQ